jgi:DNA mismatch repair protein MutL
MGFRGEALPSIASISKLTIKSCKKTEVSGSQIDVNGGEILMVKDAGMSPGTHVEVFNLFFNTPVRQKYLKQDSTELSHISSLVSSLALANPNISFKLVHNEKIIFDLPKTTDFISRISDIFGKSTADAMIPIFYGGSEFSIDGFIGKPLLSRATSQHQYFFVNGRYVQNFLLANIIKSAYHSLLMEDKKPVFTINIKIDPALVDVNVHPRKLEVRFEDQQRLSEVMYGCVKTALEKGALMPKGFTESSHYKAGFKGVVNNTYGGGLSVYGGNVHDAIKFSQNILSQNILADRDAQNLNKITEKVGIKSITQIADSYIVAEDANGLVLIDQHAAHERIRYEQLMDQFENQEKSVQPLLVPFQVELSSDEIVLLGDNKEIFEKLGFEIEGFGGNTFVVHAVPAFLAKEDTDQIIKSVLDDISNQKQPSKIQGNTEIILTYMACRSAIKFGKKLMPDEMQSLIIQLEKLKRPYTCPHGRPTMISLTLNELEKMFGRK